MKILAEGIPSAGIFFDLSGFSPRASGPAPVQAQFPALPPVRAQLPALPPVPAPARSLPQSGSQFPALPQSGSQLRALPPVPAPVQGQLPALPPVRAPASGPAPGPGPSLRLCLLPRRPSLPEAVSDCGNQSCQRAVFAWAAPSAWCSLSGLFYLGGCTCLVQSARSVSPGHPRFTQIYFPPQTPRFPSDGPVFVWLCGVKSGSIHKLFTLSQ